MRPAWALLRVFLWNGEALRTPRMLLMSELPRLLRTLALMLCLLSAGAPAAPEGEALASAFQRAEKLPRVKSAERLQLLRGLSPPPGSAEALERLYLLATTVGAPANTVSEADWRAWQAAAPPQQAPLANLVRQVAALWRLLDAETIGEAKQFAQSMAAPPAEAPALWQARQRQARAAAIEEGGDPEYAMVLRLEALSWLEQVGSDSRRSAALAALAFAQGRLDQHERALRNAEEAVRLAEKGDDDALKSGALDSLAAVLGFAGRNADSLQIGEQALQHERRADNPEGLALMLANLSDSYLLNQQPRQALQLADEAIQLTTRLIEEARRQSLPPPSNSPLILGLHNRGIAKIRLGRVAEGAADVRRSVDMELQRGGRLQAAVGLEELGEALQKAGDLSAAYRAFTQYRALAQEHTRADRRALLAKAQQNFDAQQREIEAKLLTEQNALREQTIRAQRLRYGMATLVVLVAIGLIALLAVLVRRLRRTNRLLARSNRDLAALSEVDPLTGLGNRRAMQGLLTGHKPSDGKGAALALIDIDHFKMLNDAYGHAVGDLVLQAIAGRLRGAVREVDRVVRWGGEEFLIWLSEADAELLQGMLRRVLEDIAGSPVSLRDGRSVPVSVSIGALVWPLGALPWPGDKAVDTADVLMYLAKSSGRNQAWCLLDARVGDFAALSAALIDFNAAQERGELQLAQIKGPGGSR